MLECLRLDFQIPALLHEALALGGKMYFFYIPSKTSVTDPQKMLAVFLLPPFSLNVI